MPQKPPAPNPPPPKQDDCVGYRRAFRKWDQLPCWACGHVRHSALRRRSQSELFELVACRLLTAEQVTEELLQRDLECPACRVATRRRRQHFTLIALIAAALFVLRLAACGPGATP